MASTHRGRLSLARILEVGNGDHSDGTGLVLRVRGKAASWVYRYTSPVHTGRRREIGLGAACRNDRELAESAARNARVLALEFAAAVIKGIDPKDARDSERAARQAEAADKAQQKARERRTLGRTIRDFHERDIEASSKFSDKHKAQWIASIENDLPAWRDGTLWNRPIDEVEPAELLDFVKDLQRDVPHTARKVRQRLDAVFEDAQLRKWCVTRPTQAIRRAALRSAPSMKHKSLRALPYDQAPAFMQELRSIPGIASNCLLFTVLTASRTKESTGAEWSEIDAENGVWVIRAGRMKGGEDHRVDLSPAARAILIEQQGLDPRWVFPSPRLNGKSLSSMGMLMLIRRLEMAHLTTVHGLARGTFSTWANETSAARHDVIEAALAHREADLVRAAYNKAAFLAERKALLAAWADYLIGERATNVIEFGSARALRSGVLSTKTRSGR